MNRFVTVMAHSDAQHIFDRHIGYWQMNGDLRLVMCPCDSMVRTSYPILALGTKSHHDAMANRRFRELFEFLCHIDAEEFFIHEYDSLCVGMDLPAIDKGTVFGNLFLNTERPRFSAKYFLHPPLAMKKETLAHLTFAMQQMTDESEEGFWDRYLGAAIDRSGVKAFGWGPLGFSRNTIEQHDIPAAIDARRKGALLFHGVKSDAALKAITS